ncbi:Protein CBG02238 [Caenorhabditis briggsae]|uniref:Protein CBG02238 n=2 Tax=Caenorhabditis briggsae TaxID=6238 RepID=A8WS76_CAEBR|nr:Protein CBG02238 [Caenorhabditis briggsae]ULU12136.1 hypothetical protein L3Y34_015465 [Caenorhabditis briggsae]CAP23334.1 Protein CBG02238 [Caenorhabditis briggsae]
MSDAANVEVVKDALEDLTIGKKRSSSNDEEKSPRKPRIPTAERIRLWEEEQKTKRVLSTGLQGKVKWYSVLRRYGFISRNDGEKDVFVHQTAIAKSLTEKFYLRTLGDEEEVLFDLVDGKNGPEAANVTGPDGGNVVGSRYRHKLLSRFRKNRKPRRSVDGEESGNTDAKTKEAKPNTEEEKEKKKPRKQRKNRTRKPKAHKGAGDVADSSALTESSNSAAGSPDSKSCAKIIDEEAALSKLDRCGSALGDAELGAQAIDAQI